VPKSALANQCSNVSEKGVSSSPIECAALRPRWYYVLVAWPVRRGRARGRHSADLTLELEVEYRLSTQTPHGRARLLHCGHSAGLMPLSSSEPTLRHHTRGSSQALVSLGKNESCKVFTLEHNATSPTYHSQVTRSNDLVQHPCRNPQQLGCLLHSQKFWLIPQEHRSGGFVSRSVQFWASSPTTACRRVSATAGVINATSHNSDSGESSSQHKTAP
jgi:hypothetical protein